MPKDPPPDSWDPEEVQDFWEDFEEWYAGLRKTERNEPLDVAVLTPSELCERWDSNLVTLERLLEDEDRPLMIEHSGLKNHMGTYLELRNVWHGRGYDLSFFTLKDALFRVSEILKFEEAYPDIIAALKHKRNLKKTERSDTLAHVKRNNLMKIILKIKEADTENVWSQRKLCTHVEIIEAHGCKPSPGYINKLVQKLKRAGRQFKWPDPGRKSTVNSPASKKTHS